MNEKGKFIVIEGVDGSGKTTQTNRLYKRLQKLKRKLLIADFPRYYDSVWGKMVGDLLTGKLGKYERINSYLSVLPFMIDEYTWSRDVGRPWLQEGGIILSNRFFTSNVHQIARLKGLERKMFREWLWPTGYEVLGILKPDLVLFLDVPPKVARRMNLGKKRRQYLKGKKEDQAEKDNWHQKESYEEYLLTVRLNKNWIRVCCMTKGVINSPYVIDKSVWKLVKKIL